MRWPWQRKKAPLSYLGDLVKVTVSPGDVFVLMPKRPVSGETAESLGNFWEDTFGPDCPLLILEDGMRVGILSPEAAAEAQKSVCEIEKAAEAVDNFNSGTES